MMDTKSCGSKTIAGDHADLRCGVPPDTVGATGGSGRKKGLKSAWRSVIKALGLLVFAFCFIGMIAHVSANDIYAAIIYMVIAFLGLAPCFIWPPGKRGKKKAKQK
jgi:hypothetical protein